MSSVYDIFLIKVLEDLYNVLKILNYKNSFYFISY